jgi:hypothetical protein
VSQLAIADGMGDLSETGWAAIDFASFALRGRPDVSIKPSARSRALSVSATINKYPGDRGADVAESERRTDLHSLHRDYSSRFGGRAGLPSCP